MRGIDIRQAEEGYTCGCHWFRELIRHINILVVHSRHGQGHGCRNRIQHNACCSRGTDVANAIPCPEVHASGTLPCPKIKTHRLIVQPA